LVSKCRGKESLFLDGPKAMEHIQIGLLGLGTIGSGVYRLIEDHREELEFQLGSKITVKKILVSRMDKERYINGKHISKTLLTDDSGDIFNDPSIQIVIEVIGGLENAKKLIEKALIKGKSVVTANKDVVAQYGVYLGQLAQENQCDIFYEASVGGGIPIIRSLTEGLASDKITRMIGIINGTTNYILTKMTREHMSYNEALEKAKILGYAEPDPTNDVEGYDAARKMVILSSLGFSMPMTLKDVYTVGIKAVTIDDIDYAKELGYVIKLLGYADIEEGEVEVSVQPTLLRKNHPLASVHDENNGVYLYGSAVGETMFYGPGAGAMPTATAIVSDVITVAKRLKLGVTGKQMINYKNRRTVKNDEKIHAKFYLRLKVKDEVGVLKEITGIFANRNLSFESILQKPTGIEKEAGLIIITHEVVLANYIRALKELKNLETVNSIESSYRVLS